MAVRRSARGFALLALLGAALGPVALAKDDPARGKPGGAGKTAGEQRMALLAALDGERAAAAKAKDAVAAQVIDEVRTLLSGDAPLGAAPPVSEEGEPRPWLESAWRRVGPQADRLAESGDAALAALGGLARQVPDVVAALRVLNRRRAACALRPFRFNGSRSRGCVLHARYLATAGFAEIAKRLSGFHGEEASDPLATPEGRMAAGSSVLGMYPLADTVENLLDTFIHRLPLLVPGEASIAMGTWTATKESASVLLNGGDPAGDGREIPAGVCYPPAQGTDASRAFLRSGEVPAPVLGVDLASLGCPVTVTFYARGTPTGVEATLATGKGAPVPCYVVTPQAPLNPKATWPVYVMQSVALIPRSQLDAATTYQATVRCHVGELSWEKTWRFTTR